MFGQEAWKSLAKAMRTFQWPRTCASRELHSAFLQHASACSPCLLKLALNPGSSWQIALLWPCSLSICSRGVQAMAIAAPTFRCLIPGGRAIRRMGQRIITQAMAVLIQSASSKGQRLHVTAPYGNLVNLLHVMLWKRSTTRQQRLCMQFSPSHESLSSGVWHWV